MEPSPAPVTELSEIWHSPKAESRNACVAPESNGLLKREPATYDRRFRIWVHLTPRGDLLLSRAFSISERNQPAS